MIRKELETRHSWRGFPRQCRRVPRVNTTAREFHDICCIKGAVLAVWDPRHPFASHVERMRVGKAKWFPPGPRLSSICLRSTASFSVLNPNRVACPIIRLSFARFAYARTRREKDITMFATVLDSSLSEILQASMNYTHRKKEKRTDEEAEEEKRKEEKEWNMDLVVRIDWIFLEREIS